MVGVEGGLWYGLRGIGSAVLIVFVLNGTELNRIESSVKRRLDAPRS